MIIVPKKNTLLYVEPIYQTMLNESEVPVLKKVIVASGNKVAIGNSLSNALENLLSKYAVDFEVENKEDVEGLIEAIFIANENLTNSYNNYDCEMMGKDVQKLQDLITSLEQVKEKEDKKKEELEKTTSSNNTIANEVNTTENTSSNSVENNKTNN